MTNEVNPGLVSVIIPTFNRAGMVEKAVESVLAQEYPKKQIIVIDDGSTDDTAQRMKRFPDVEYYQQANQRQAAARTHGLRKARGEFIASLDSDDLWHQSFLSESVLALNRNSAALSFSNWTWAGESGESAYEIYRYLEKYKDVSDGKWFKLDPVRTRDLFIQHCPAPSSAAVIRRSAIKNGWNQKTRISDDWLLWLDAIFNFNISSVFTMKPLWTKRLDGINICDNLADRCKFARNSVIDVELIYEHYGGFLTPQERRLLDQKQAENYFDLAYHESEHGERRTALRHYLNSFRLKPSLRPCLGMLKTLKPGC